jgi:hypothetical protein
MVAWCTKPGHGTRLIPQDALQGVQFIKAPNYVMIAGFIDQRYLNLNPSDYGGEMDPHGADLRGNPMGGLVYSGAFGSGTTQVIEWTKYVKPTLFPPHKQQFSYSLSNSSFMGGNAFCFKACDQSKPNAAQYCEHRLDRIGCAYNVPNNAQNGTFESCDGDNQDFPGVYTDSAGAVQTYTQPPEDAGPITSMPYTPKVPASSNCVTYTSSAIYTGLPSVQVAAAAASGASGSSSSGSKTGSGAGAKNTHSGATTLAISGVSILGVVFSALFLA